MPLYTFSGTQFLENFKKVNIMYRVSKKPRKLLDESQEPITKTDLIFGII